MYQPKKQKYNDLVSLAKEMVDAGVKGVLFNGHQILTNDAKYTLYNSKVIIIPTK